MKCLDTDVLISFLRGENEAIDYVKKARDKGASLAATWISSCELLKGARISGDPHEIAAVRNLLASLDILLPAAGTAETYAGLDSERRRGKAVGDFDLIIAAIAVENNQILVTCDKDFETIPGLKIEKWR